MTSEDYPENRDPALAAILTYRDERTLTDVMREKALSGGPTTAATAYRDFLRRHPDRWGRTHEDEVNRLGYALLGEGRTTAAVGILALNAEQYPRSANAWDSLAEATAANGDTAKAIALYQRALELDPELGSARRAVERLTRR
jgi:tetratricopeptide (TPR) repeat protein